MFDILRIETHTHHLGTSFFEYISGLNMDEETIVTTLSKGGALQTEDDLIYMKGEATARIVIVSISNN